MHDDNRLDGGEGAALVEGLKLALIALVAAALTAGTVIGLGELFGARAGPLLVQASETASTPH